MTRSSPQVIDSLLKEIRVRDSIIVTWEDHANRMKRIVGMPEELSWSYKQKCINSIDTRRIVGKNSVK